MSACLLFTMRVYSNKIPQHENRNTALRQVVLPLLADKRGTLGSGLGLSARYYLANHGLPGGCLPYQQRNLKHLSVSKALRTLNPEQRI